MISAYQYSFFFQDVDGKRVFYDNMKRSSQYVARFAGTWSRI